MRSQEDKVHPISGYFQTLFDLESCHVDKGSIPKNSHNPPFPIKLVEFFREELKTKNNFMKRLFTMESMPNDKPFFSHKSGPINTAMCLQASMGTRIS